MTATYDYDMMNNRAGASITQSDSIYLRARYYTPNTGRFAQEDPIRDGNNWYVYCYNNPLVLTDYHGCVTCKKKKWPEK